jgi:peroxiredoxin
LAPGDNVNSGPGELIVMDDRVAPDFNRAGFSGQQISLDQFQGKAVVLNFWACGATRVARWSAARGNTRSPTVFWWFPGRGGQCAVQIR